MNLSARENRNTYLSDSLAFYIRKSLSNNSIRALKSDLAHFMEWGGAIPCTPETIAGYLSAFAEDLSIATLKRRLASISKAHKMNNQPSPVQSELVQMTLRGIQRTHGTPQAQATPLLREDIIALYGQIQSDTKGIRDKALLLTGFCGAFRRSELVGLNIADIEFMAKGAVITLRRSKTDQTGTGRKIAIPYGRGRICAVKALQAWIECLGENSGPLFRSVGKGGKISESRLSDHAVSCIVKEHAEKIGLDPARYSGHSLRSGLATSAAMHGVSSWKIRAQTGHTSDAMLARYIRDGDLFTDNAAGSMF